MDCSLIRFRKRYLTKQNKTKQKNNEIDQQQQQQQRKEKKLDYNVKGRSTKQSAQNDENIIFCIENN